MARKLSRRVIARHIAGQLVDASSQAKVVQQLAAYLVVNRRTKELPLIVRDIQQVMVEKGHVVGTVTTAYELSAETKKAIDAFTKQATGATSVELDALVDESVLGGVRVTLPGGEYDTTIAHQLKLLRTRYKKA